MMGKRIYLSKGTGRRRFKMVMLTLIFPVFFGCASTYGSLQSSREVTEAFENNQVLSNYQYYYSGFERIPYGLIGIDNNYSLRSRYWKPIDPDSRLLDQWAYRMKHVYSLPPRGAWILDQHGNRVGIWYSSQYYTTVKTEKENQIVVYPPTPPDLSGIP